MTDFETFKLHWERAVNGLVGRVSQDGRAIFTRNDINTMWREELLDHRFRPVGLRDEAQVFLDDLFDRRPGTAKRLLDKLAASRLEVGVEVESAALKGVAAVGSAALAGLLWNSGLGQAARLAGTALTSGASVCLAGSAAAGIGSASKRVIAEEIRAAADRQLAGFRALLESGEGAGK